MSVLNPQSMLSSRIHTNNVFKVDETRKPEPVNREKININLNLNKGSKLELEGDMNDSAIPNNSDRSSKKKADDKFTNKNNDGFDYDKKNTSFDDRIFKTKQNSCFIGCSRLQYSKNCIYFYIGLIAISVLVFLYSIYGYFAKLDELPIIICEIGLIFIIAFDMSVKICSTVNKQLIIDRVSLYISVNV